MFSFFSSRFLVPFLFFIIEKARHVSILYAWFGLYHLVFLPHGVDRKLKTWPFLHPKSWLEGKKEERFCSKQLILFAPLKLKKKNRLEWGPYKQPIKICCLLLHDYHLNLASIFINTLFPLPTAVLDPSQISRPCLVASWIKL